MQVSHEFLWGVASASYQVEGAARADGRGESIWDRFSHTPGKVLGGGTGDVACDHYHRFGSDFDLMGELGINSYRFSISWPRVMPDGAGRINQAGLDFYARLIDRLLQKSIVPMATMYHWDLPQALEDQGGWGSRETSYRFAEYAEVLGRALGDRVHLWATLNEPWCSAFLGYGTGEHAPGHRDWGVAVRASHHLLVAHGLAVKAFRSAAPSGARVGIVLNPSHVYPETEGEADLAAARLMDGHQNRWFYDPVLKGRYPGDMLNCYERITLLDFIQPGDLQVISEPIDFLGINNYTRMRVRAGGEHSLFPVGWVPSAKPVTDMGWEIYPEGLYDLLVRIKREYGEIQLYVTENGAAFKDRVGPDGSVADPERVAYLDAYIGQALRARADGVNLKGYYVWTFLDNFEWAWGYTKRFGIVYVDYPGLKRIPKQSFYWYRDLIARGAPVTR